MSNLLTDMLNSITEVIKRYSKGQERSVSISAVFQALQEQLNGAVSEDGNPAEAIGYVLDVYMENEGTFAIATKQDGKLYKYPVTVDENSVITFGAEEEVLMDFAPATPRQLSIKRQADGSMRWFALPACTAVLNRSGEIDSRALFDSFVEHVERTGIYPELDFFHMGEQVLLGRADWVARDDTAYCASGTFYDTPIAQAAAKSLEELGDYWGLSIAYVATEEPTTLRSSEGIEIPVYEKGINRFISLLPEKTAASILTGISTNEVNRMNKTVEEALKKLTGDDEALFKEFQEKLDSINRNATGMISRENPEAPVATTAPEQTETKEVKGREVTEDDVTMIIGTDAFKGAVREIVMAVMSEQQEEKEKEPEPVAVVAPVESTEQKSLMKAIEQLRATVEELNTDKKATVDDLLNDLPSRVARTTVIRPRATRMPNDLKSRRAETSYADIAEQTLQAIGEN